MARLLFITFSFILTVIIGAVAFAFTAMTYPTTMRQLMSNAEQLRNQLGTIGINDSYMVWVDILLQGDNLVLMGFIIAARIIMALLGALFSRGSYDDDGPRRSPRRRWG
jgi:hypothetical protein